MRAPPNHPLHRHRAIRGTSTPLSAAFHGTPAPFSLVCGRRRITPCTMYPASVPYPNAAFPSGLDRRSTVSRPVLGGGVKRGERALCVLFYPIGAHLALPRTHLRPVLFCRLPRPASAVLRVVFRQRLDAPELDLRRAHLCEGPGADAALHHRGPGEHRDPLSVSRPARPTSTRACRRHMSVRISTPTWPGRFTPHPTLTP